MILHDSSWWSVPVTRLADGWSLSFWRCIHLFGTALRFSVHCCALIFSDVVYFWKYTEFKKGRFIKIHLILQSFWTGQRLTFRMPTGTIPGKHSMFLSLGASFKDSSNHGTHARKCIRTRLMFNSCLTMNGCRKCFQKWFWIVEVQLEIAGSVEERQVFSSTDPKEIPKKCTTRDRTPGPS